VSAATKQSPRIHIHLGARRFGVVAGGRSISTLAVLQFWGLFLFSLPSGAQSWDLGSRLADYVPSHTNGQLRVGFEQRIRYESRGGNAFGRDPDTFAALERTRVSLTYENSLIKASAMMQDSRAPWYGSPAPNNLRDTADLQEAYFELFPKHKTGFGLLAGRYMLNYGEGRVLGSPQWGNTARTYDHARMFYATRRLRVEAMFASPVKVRTDAFNQPFLSDRYWGLYNTIKGKAFSADVYLLRHDNIGRVRVNMLGFRLTGPLGGGWKFSLEGGGQNGVNGPGEHRAAAWFSGVSRRWSIRGHNLDFSAEYKFASGSANPRDLSRSRTYDQFSPANHDKFGHDDLLGWKNLHDIRSLTTYAWTKALSINFMYNHMWLASACDSLYNSSGRSIARSATCSAGRHVGQETDLFGVYRYRHFQFGAGFGYFFPGRFLQLTTPGAASTYVYVFHTYSL
jgi:hypothetical protein